MKMTRLLALCPLIVAPLMMWSAASAAEVEKRPNVLLIAVDDLNDWVGCLGGHPQAKTPNMDSLAGRGVLFSNAHCQSPVCNPSRASLMTSLYPETSGIYFLSPPVWESPAVGKLLTMPERFESEGYQVAAAGKLFHSRGNAKYFKDYGGSMGGFGPTPKKQPPFPRPPVRPNDCSRGLPQKQIPSSPTPISSFDGHLDRLILKWDGFCPISAIWL